MFKLQNVLWNHVTLPVRHLCNECCLPFSALVWRDKESQSTLKVIKALGIQIWPPSVERHLLHNSIKIWKAMSVHIWVIMRTAVTAVASFHWFLLHMYHTAYAINSFVVSNTNSESLRIEYGIHVNKNIQEIPITLTVHKINSLS